MKRLIGCPQSVRKILLKSILQSIILVAYRCIEDCKLASRWFLVGFVANSIDRIFAETSAVCVPSLRRLCLQCNCSILLLPLYILCLQLTAFAFAVPLLALNLKSTFSVLRSSVCKSFPARISSHLLNSLLLSLLLSFICLRYWVVIHQPQTLL